MPICPDCKDDAEYTTREQDMGPIESFLYDLVQPSPEGGSFKGECDECLRCE